MEQENDEILLEIMYKNRENLVFLLIELMFDYQFLVLRMRHNFH